MWRKCPVVLDPPWKCLGLEGEDLAVATGIYTLISFWCDTLPSVLVGIGTGLVLYLVKRHKPRGAMLHTLAALELVRLPGVLSVRRQRYSPW